MKITLEIDIEYEIERPATSTSYVAKYGSTSHNKCYAIARGETIDEALANVLEKIATLTRRTSS